ncbi:MAG: glycosyl hydrolase family 65 protein [Solirubrobacteraceae bacterium]|jgi:trehalose/maltose hydrolase-like predicted phosphorylase
MTSLQGPPSTDPAMGPALARRFEAVVVDWDGATVPDGHGHATRLRHLIEESCGAGIEVAIVSGDGVESVDGQLGARPDGPGSLVLALHHGAKIFRVGPDGPQLQRPPPAAGEQETALAHAAEVTITRLAAHGITAVLGPKRPHRCRIDLLPVSPGAPAGQAGAALQIAGAAAAEAGLADALITGDAAHVEIGLIDGPGSMRWFLRRLWKLGIGSDQVLAAGRDAIARVLEDQIARRHDGELPLVAVDQEWTLAIDDAEPRRDGVDESLLTLGDGRLGTRGSRLVGNADDDPTVLLSGVYTGQGSESRLLAGPSWNTIELVAPAVLSARRVLDLHAGTLSHELLGGDTRLAALLLSSLDRPAMTVMRVRGLGARLRDQRDLRPGPDGEHDGGERDGCTWMRTVGSPGSIAAAAHHRVDDQRAHGTAVDWVLDRVSAYEGADAGPADERAALARVHQGRALGFDTLLSDHRRAWAERWEHADVRIDGDPELQLAVRLALYHLMAAVADDGEAGVGARGLSGGGYRGHVFWDSDVHVLPFLAATHPSGARAMLEYRVRRLPAALRAARAHRHRGARFPWESAATGEEVTPDWVLNSRGDVDPVYTGAQEEHIVADVAWAAAHYIDWTGDQAFAAGPGLALLVETARWWASRIEPDADGSGHIRGVMGPDEYHPLIDDNAYTNVMARWNLRRAAAMSDGTIDQAERHRWRDLADSIADGYDPATGIYEQFAGFYALEPLLIADLAPRPVPADILLGHERTQNAQIVKQADVLMLHYLVPDEVAAGSLEPNIDFYDPRTAHGSTLSPGVHAALLARAGRCEPALEMLRLTAHVDIDDIGHTTRDGVHLAAMGSVWRAIAYGYAGLRPVGDALAIDPTLAPGWQTLDLRVQFRGSRVHIVIRPDAVEVTADPPIRALISAGETVTLTPTAQTFELSPRASPSLDPPLRS